MRGPKKTCRRCGTHHWQQGDYCRQCQTSLDKGEWAEVLSADEAMERERQKILDDAPKPRDVYKLITYPFPLSDGTMAYLNLPEAISRKDVERMCEMLRTLPFSEA
jgi:hypothetical protein